MGTPELWEALVGLGLGALLAFVGYRLALLTVGGGLVVLVSVAGAFATAGWEWGAVLVIHLLSTGVWSRYRYADKRGLAPPAEVAVRSGVARTTAQVGWPLLLALFRRTNGDSVVVYAAFVGAVAAATADAWNSEVGVLSPERPRLITSRQRVPAGTPGAVSSLGLVAALGGSWLVGFAALGVRVLGAWLAVQPWDRGLLWLPLVATMGGMLGSLVDSLLGATAQVIYLCDRCEQVTQSPQHTCGERARRIRGIPWLTGEAVDMVATLVGSASTALVVGLLARVAA